MFIYSDVSDVQAVRDSRHEPKDEYEAVTSEDETELSISAAAARYLRLREDATAEELLQSGIELLSLGGDTRGLAFDAFRRAKAIKGAEAEALYRTAEAHIEDGEAAKAMRALEESLKFGELAVALGRLYELQDAAGFSEQAAATMERLSLIVELE